VGTDCTVTLRSISVSVVEPIVDNNDRVAINLLNGTPQRCGPHHWGRRPMPARAVGLRQLHLEVLYLDRASVQTALVGRRY